MASFHQFTFLPTEIRLRIWELAVEPRLILIQYSQKAREYLPDPKTPPPALMQACNESRTLGLGHYYVQAFQPKESDRYHWVSYPTDIFVIDIPDLRRIDRPETALMHNLRVEVGAGSTTDDGDEWYDDGSLPYLGKQYPVIRTFDLLVDQPLIDWVKTAAMSYLGRQCEAGGFRIIEVRSGEWLGPENCFEYHDWHGLHQDLAGGEQSFRFVYSDGTEPERYTSEVCPTGRITDWTFPPEPSLNWGY